MRPAKSAPESSIFSSLNYTGTAHFLTVAEAKQDLSQKRTSSDRVRLTTTIPWHISSAARSRNPAHHRLRPFTIHLLREAHFNRPPARILQRRASTDGVWQPHFRRLYDAVSQDSAESEADHQREQLDANVN